jgi:hypothetical protein
MAGPPWKPEEELVLIDYKRQGYFDKDIQTALREKGMKRTLVALRSKLYALRKDPAVFDGGQWKEEAVQRLKRKVEEKQEGRGKRNEGEEGDQAQYDLA